MDGANALEQFERSPLHSGASLFDGGGQVGELIPDWSQTPVGPVDGWPQSLNTALSVPLKQHTAVFIFSGREHDQFYNDAYRPILESKKHLAAMGQRGAPRAQIDESSAENLIGNALKYQKKGNFLVYEFVPLAATQNGFSRWKTMGLGLIATTTPKFSLFSRGFILNTITLEAALGWRSASESWSDTGAVFGWTPLLAEDPPSSSPFPTPPAPSARGSESPAEKPSIPTVLLVEDNSSDVYVIRQALKRSGLAANLEVVFDGEEAISRIQKVEEAGSRQMPSLILLDWNLPKASGAEVLSELRKTEAWSHIPVVIVTSTNSPQEIAEMHRLGAVAHFRKPTDLDAYLALGDLIRLTLTKAFEE